MGKLAIRNDAPIAGGARSRRVDTIGNAAGGWTNTLTGQGLSDDRHAFTGFLYRNPIDWFTVDALIRFEPIGRRVVNREPDDAVREGFTVLVDEKPAPDFNARTQAEVKRLNLLAAVANARRWARAYGGAGILVFTDDGAPPTEPLDPARVRRVLSVLVLDCTQLTVVAWNTDITSPRFNTPEMYSVSTSHSSDVTTIHASRVIRFIGETLTNREILNNGGWGGSTLDLVWSALRNYQTTNEYATEAITLLSQGVWAVEGLTKAYASGRIDSVVERIEAIRHGMGLLGDVIVDRDKETYDVKARSLSGLRDAMEGIERALVAATDMPRSILFGETPGGLNTGENAGEVRSWYDHISSLQSNLYEPRLLQILDLVWGPAKPLGVTIQWEPLWQPTEQEQAQTELTNAQRRSLDVAAQVVSPAEARRDPSVAEIYGIDVDGPMPPGLEGEPGVLPAGAEPGEDARDQSELEVIATADPADIPEGEALISAQEASQRLGVGPAAIRGLAARGEIMAWRIGRRWRYAWSQIKSAAQGNPLAPRADADPSVGATR